jgi:hypothetical protein
MRDVGKQRGMNEHEEVLQTTKSKQQKAKS